MTDHEKAFTFIYDNKVWGEGSGGGSNPENNVEYMEFLQNFLKEKDIKSVVDFGCGDWQFSKLIDWTGINYVGVDCVLSVINENNRMFHAPNITFIHEQVAFGMVADLLILKDVLQHWTDEKIIEFLDEDRKFFKYILICNSLGSGTWQHETEPNVLTRPISALTYPLNKYGAKVIKNIENNPNDIKELSIIE